MTDKSMKNLNQQHIFNQNNSIIKTEAADEKKPIEDNKEDLTRIINEIDNSIMETKTLSERVLKLRLLAKELQMKILTLFSPQLLKIKEENGIVTNSMITD